MSDTIAHGHPVQLKGMLFCERAADVKIYLFLSVVFGGSLSAVSVQL